MKVAVKEKVNELEFEGIKYNIVDEFEATDVEANSDYIVYKTDKEEIFDLYAWYPVWIKNKFRWFKQIKVKKVFYLSKHLEFDDGWSYQHYWGKLKGEWRWVEIID